MFIFCILGVCSNNTCIVIAKWWPLEHSIVRKRIAYLVDGVQLSFVFIKTYIQTKRTFVARLAIAITGPKQMPCWIGWINQCFYFYDVSVDSWFFSFFIDILNHNIKTTPSIYNVRIASLVRKFQVTWNDTFEFIPAINRTR